MEIYQINYKEYIVLMNLLKEHIGFIINTTPDNTRKMLAIKASQSIDNTIATAKAEINLPSSELYDITNQILALRTCGNPPIPEVLDEWKKSLDVLNQAALVLKNITDDAYLNDVLELVSNK